MKRSFLVLSCLLLTGALLPALPPSWWSDEETRILDESVENADNFAPANLGQLKHVATQAKSHLDANLLGGSGTAVANVVAGFVTGTTPEEMAQNYAPLNIGQLKAVAKPFYDRLLSAGYDTKANLIARGYSGTWAFDYPWNPSTPVAENYGPANLGQLKMTFSFDLSGFDSDEDGLPDTWESEQFGDLESAADGNPDGDGLSNLEEYEAGTSPLLRDTDGDGIEDDVELANNLDPLVADAPVTWTKIAPSGLKASDNFGQSVAIDGDFALVGAPNDDGIKTNGGTVYVFQRISGVWTFSTKIYSLDPVMGDGFGTTVALSGDHAIVGVPFRDKSGVVDAGAAYVFQRSGTTWTQVKKFSLAPNSVNWKMGSRVAIYPGILGIAGISTNTSGVQAGEMRIYTGSGTSWSINGTYTQADLSMNGDMAYAGTVDGPNLFTLRIIEGNRYGSEVASNAGSARMGQWVVSSGTLSLHVLDTLNPPTLSVGDQYGYGADYQGGTAIIGAPKDDAGGADAGAVYVFREDEANVWNYLIKQLAPDVHAGDEFGKSVAIHGNQIVVGAPGSDAVLSNAGAVYFGDISLLEFNAGDSDGDGLPDWWEAEQFGNQNATGAEDPDGDGLSNRQEYEQGGDPNDYYSQGGVTITPSISIAGGDNQIGDIDTYLAEPLSVEVRSSTGGSLLVNAPVVFTVTSGSGALAMQHSSTMTSPAQTIVTGSNGVASAFYRQGSTWMVTSTISVQAGTSDKVEFHATTQSDDPLVAHWKLDEGDGLVISDSGPYQMTGTLAGAANWAERYPGEWSLSFSGSGGHVAMHNATNGALDFAEDSFSIAAWVKVDAEAGRIVSKGNEISQAGYSLGVSDEGKIEAGLGTTVSGSSAEAIHVTTTGTFNDGAWHHVAAVYDRESSSLRVYVDGTSRALVKEERTGGTISVEDSALLEYPALQHLSASRPDAEVAIASQSGTSAFLAGGIDDVRIYGKALSAEEVAELFETDGPLTAVPQTVAIDEDTLGVITLNHQGGGQTGQAVYEITEEPEHGEAQQQGNVVNYYPNAHFSGSDSFTFRVTKGERVSDAAVAITVKAVNDPPLVSVGGGQSIVMFGSTATLSLNATVTDIDTDPEDIQLNWIKVSGAGGVTFTGSNPLAVTATFDTAGEHVLRLIAYDGDSTRTDSLIVVVNGRGTSALPVVSLEEPSDNQAYGLNESIGLKADASADAGLTISKVEFYEGSRKIGEAATPSGTSGWFELDWTPQRLGVYQISAKATDSAASAAFSEAIQVRVTEGGWFTDDVVPGNDGFAGSGGNGGIVAGAPTGSGGYGPGTGANGGGSSAGGGSSNGGTPENEEEIDSDGDSLPDDEDAVPFMKIMTVPAAPEVRYAVIDLGVDKILQGVNDAGQALLIKRRSGGAPYFDGGFWKDGNAEELDSANGFYGPLQDGAVIVGEEAELEFVGAGYIWKEASKIWKDGQLSGGLPPMSEDQYGNETPPEGELPEVPFSSELIDLYSLANAYAYRDSVSGENRWSSMRSINDNRAYSYGSSWGIEEWVDVNLLYAHLSWWPGGVIASGWSVDILDANNNDEQVYAGEGSHAVDLRVSNDGIAVATFTDYTMVPSGYSPQPPKVVVMAGAGEQEIPGASKVIDLNEEKTIEGPYFLCEAGSAAILTCYNGGSFATINLPKMPPDIEWTRSEPFVPGRSVSNSLVIPMGESIWRNSKLKSVSDLVSKESEWSTFDMRVVTPNNNILGGYAHRDGAKHAVMLVPCDLAVDANRDGFIKFSGNYNSSEAAGKPQDKTEEAKPFQFWCNDDNDGDSGAGTEDPDSTQKDSRDNEIKSARDLEDFTRLHLNIGGLQDAIAAGTITVGLEWRNPSGYPAIKIYRAAETNGGDQYLETALGAGQQSLGTTATSLGTVSREGSYKFPISFWQADPLSGLPAFSASNPNRFLLFEGVTAGKGQLVFTFWKGTEKIGEGPGVWIDLVNIKKMYVRSAGNQFVPPGAPEGDDTIIFVHGWRMSPNGRSAFAESFYKRLWHRGFKGRFAAFQWETHWNADNHFWAQYIGPIDAYLSRYNDSEYVAWNSAAALKDFVNGLPGARKHIAAHSMGNIVTSEAIRLGMGVNNYAMMQAAVPSACYDPDPRNRQTTTYNHFTFTMWDKQTPDDDPDPATRALAYRGRFSNLGVNLVSFYLERDYATFMPWEVNNDQTKPEGGSLAANFRYLGNNPNGQKLYKYTSVFPAQELLDYYLTDPYEAMSYACSTWGKAVGAQNVAQGALTPGNNVDLSNASFALPGESFSGFGDEHSGQFNANIHYLKLFYDRLLDEFEVRRNDP